MQERVKADLFPSKFTAPAAVVSKKVKLVM